MTAANRSSPRPVCARFAGFGALGVRQSAAREGGKPGSGAAIAWPNVAHLIPACAGTTGVW